MHKFAHSNITLNYKILKSTYKYYGRLVETWHVTEWIYMQL